MAEAEAASDILAYHRQGAWQMGVDMMLKVVKRTFIAIGLASVIQFGITNVSWAACKFKGIIRLIRRLRLVPWDSALRVGRLCCGEDVAGNLLRCCVQFDGAGFWSTTRLLRRNGLGGHGSLIWAV